MRKKYILSFLTMTALFAETTSHPAELNLTNEKTSHYQIAQTTSTEEDSGKNQGYAKPTANAGTFSKRSDLFDYYQSTEDQSSTFLSLEWLYWQLNQQASYSALTPRDVLKPGPSSGFSSLANGDYQEAKFGFDSGVRVGLGYTFKRDGWQLLGQYTYYKTGKTTTFSTPNEGTEGLFIHPIVPLPVANGGYMATIQTDTKFNYNIADLLLSKRFLVGSELLVSLSTGVTSAWIHEKIGVDHIDSNGQLLTLTNKWRFNGAGIRTGLNTDWHVGSGFGFFNKLSLAGVVGRYHYNQQMVYEPAVATYFSPFKNVSERNTLILPTTQFVLGANWNHKFSSCALQLLAAFEINTLYDLHEIFQQSNDIAAPINGGISFRDGANVNLWGINLGVDLNF